MASVKKFTHSAAVNQLRHVLRETKNPSNTNIDPVCTPLNYTLSPDRGISAYSFYLKRKGELYNYNRPSDVKTLAGWVVTAPKDLKAERRQAFFLESYQFLENRYGRENTVLATVHLDENRPHLHFLFIPAAPDPKHGGYKVCANDVLTRAELRDFHPALGKHLKAAGITAYVLKSVATGGSHTASEFKTERKFEKILKERMLSK